MQGWGEVCVEGWSGGWEGMGMDEKRGGGGEGGGGGKRGKRRKGGRREGEV